MKKFGDVKVTQDTNKNSASDLILRSKFMSTG